MQGFSHIGDLSSSATRSVELRRLTDTETRVYQYFMEVLGNGRVPKNITLSQVASKFGITYWQARKSKDSLVKKGFLEQWTTTHKDTEKGPGFFKRTTYYRIKF